MKLEGAWLGDFAKRYRGRGAAERGREQWRVARKEVRREKQIPRCARDDRGEEKLETRIRKLEEKGAYNGKPEIRK
jgi:hypothetical protein